MKKTMEKNLNTYAEYLKNQEKSANTVSKYTRDARGFLEYLGRRTLSQEAVVSYKEFLKKRYKISSANSKLVALNNFLVYLGRADLRVHEYRQQRRIFREEERELDREEYLRLLRTAEAEGQHRLSCIMQTLGSTGMRIGELKSLTVAAVRSGTVVIDSKGKERVILLTETLQRLLREYCAVNGICSGPVFVTVTGAPVDRRSVWAAMKKLCRSAGVRETKVFPQNLRHLFAISFYEKEHDLVRLADYMGHSSVETTRRYTMISRKAACRQQLEMGMVLCMGERLEVWPEVRGGRRADDFR